MNGDEHIDSTPKIFIGMGGWELPPFNGVFYPAKLPKGFRKLEYYSQFFNMVEINATFYNTSLSPAQAQRWLKDVSQNPEFIFTVKLYRGFTHTFDATRNDALAVHQMLDPLREAKKLEGLVIQFSSLFERTDERRRYLLQLRSAFSEDPLFLDLRHSSWDNDLFYQFCRDHGLRLINVDLPALPNHRPLHSFSWEATAYFRMMGRNAQAWKNPADGDRYFYPYSEEELHDLVQRIHQLGAKKTYVVFHNDRQAFSLVNGRQVEHVLFPAKRLKAPANLLAAFPRLKPFCDLPENDRGLFSPSHG